MAVVRRRSDPVTLCADLPRVPRVEVDVSRPGNKKRDWITETGKTGLPVPLGKWPIPVHKPYTPRYSGGLKIQKGWAIAKADFIDERVHMTRKAARRVVVDLNRNQLSGNTEGKVSRWRVVRVEVCTQWWRPR